MMPRDWRNAASNLVGKPLCSGNAPFIAPHEQTTSNQRALDGDRSALVYPAM